MLGVLLIVAIACEVAGTPLLDIAANRSASLMTWAATGDCG